MREHLIEARLGSHEAQQPAQDAVPDGNLFIDSDGDLCIAGRKNNLVACLATDDADGNWQPLNPDVFPEIVRRWNANPPQPIDPAEVLAKVPPAPAVPDDVAKLWQDTADNDDFCALFGLIPLRDTATGEAIMWQEKSGDFIDFAVALRDALETQADAVARLVKAVKNERHHKSAYDATPTDRRGYNGPKGQAYVLWCEARADVGTALKEIEASPCPAAGGAESV